MRDPGPSEVTKPGLSQSLREILQDLGVLLFPSSSE